MTLKSQKAHQKHKTFSLSNNNNNKQQKKKTNINELKFKKQSCTFPFLSMLCFFSLGIAQMQTHDTHTATPPTEPTAEPNTTTIPKKIPLIFCKQFSFLFSQNCSIGVRLFSFLTGHSFMKTSVVDARHAICSVDLSAKKQQSQSTTTMRCGGKELV